MRLVQLYIYFKLIKKSIKNAYVIIHRLWLKLINAINHKLKTTREIKQKREKIAKIRKQNLQLQNNRKTRRKLVGMIKKKIYYKSKTNNKIDIDQTNNEFLVIL